MGLNFNIALTGLYGSQKALQVVSNNIANAETDGYAKQRVDFTTSQNLVGGGVSREIGSGVVTQEITRITDEYLINRVREESSMEGYYKALESELSNIETIFGENKIGSITSLTNEFFSAVDEVAKYPEQNAYRMSMISAADQLAQRTNYIATQIGETKAELGVKIEDYVEKINNLANKIAEINEKIGSTSTENPNAFYDERDKFIDELAQYSEIRVVRNVKNPKMVDVEFSGSTLVSGDKSNGLQMMYSETQDKYTLYISSTSLLPRSGELTGVLEARNNYIPQYQNQLNNLMTTIMTETNAIHQTGFGLDNTTGLDLFVGTDASSMAVNSVLLSNPEKLATSSVVSTVGNSDTMKAMSALKDSLIADGGTKTVLGYWGGVVFEMASDLEQTNDLKEVHANLKENFEIERQSVQGVNMDEELSNMMKFQRFYQANAKVIAAIDEAFDSLFQLIK